ncbi:hypothetical protein Tco_1303981 [Tanacetum coccineum]
MTNVVPAPPTDPPNTLDGSRPQHIDEFDLKDETSLSEYDEVEQNVLYFNDLFPFNIIYPNDPKSRKDNDDNEIDIIQSSGGKIGLQERIRRIRYQGLEYSNQDIAYFEERLGRIHDRDTHRVHVLDFEGMLEMMRDVLYARMLMEHRDDDGVVVFTSQAWGRVFETRGPLVRELILEFLAGLDLERCCLISTDGDFLGPPPSYTLIRDPVLRLCHRMMAHSIAGRSQVPARPARKEGDAGGVAEEAPVALGGGDEDEEMPQAVSPPPRTQGERITRSKEEVHGVREVLQGQREVLDSMAHDFSRFTTWTVTSLSRMMDRAGVTYTRYFESPVEYQRRNIRQRTDEPSTSAAPQQHDP